MEKSGAVRPTIGQPLAIRALHNLGRALKVLNAELRGADGTILLIGPTRPLRRMRAAKTASGARVTLVLFGDGARHGQDRRRGAGAPLSDPSRPLAGLEGV